MSRAQIYAGTCASDLVAMTPARFACFMARRRRHALLAEVTSGKVASIPQRLHASDTLPRNGSPAVTHEAISPRQPPSSEVAR